MRRLILFVFIFLSIRNINGQCTPASSDFCNEANLLCSLADLSGYSCRSNVDINSNGCKTLCPLNPKQNRAQWWSFFTNGGEACISIYISNCQSGQSGLQFGIWEDCSCVKSVDCNANCTSSGNVTLCAQLEKCKVYYLFVNSCSSSPCEYTIITKSESYTPNLKININGPKAICAGAKKNIYSVNPGSDFCPNTKFNWTLDGVDLNQSNASIQLGFPDVGLFILCVSSEINNPANKSSTCPILGPTCISIRSSNSFKVGTKTFPCRITPTKVHPKLDSLKTGENN